MIEVVRSSTIHASNAKDENWSTREFLSKQSSLLCVKTLEQNDAYSITTPFGIPVDPEVTMA
jgi:hypothetical protein